jgi:HEAT repeat protein
MKRFCAILISLALPFAAHCAEEDQLLTVLKSDQSFKVKDAACSRLKWIGTAESVPVLATLLTNDDLSHSARYALESMPCPEAGRALLAALNTTSGTNEVGIINSLAMRHDMAAISPLGKRLHDSDPVVASAAAEALGRLGGPKSVKLLQAALQGADEVVRAAEIDGLLACANTLLIDGKNSAALKIFQSVYENAKSDDTHLAAWRGVLLASGSKGRDLMIESISGSDLPRQGAALQVADQLKGTAVTKALGEALPKVQIPVQIALLQCLDLRGDPAAMSAIAPLADCADANVRIAAIIALGDVGDGSVALLLAHHAAEGTGAERNAARQSLDNLRHGKVTPALLEPLMASGQPATSPEVSSELLRALGDRGDAAAAPALLELASRSDDAIRAPALQSLAMLAGAAQIPQLVQLVTQATNDDVRSEAADALTSVYQRGHQNGQPVIEAVTHGPMEVRLVLLPVCSSIVDAPARDALRAAMADPERRVQEAAIRAVCETRDGQLLPDLVQVACGNSNKTFRVLAVRGCVRLATQDEEVKLSNDEKLDALSKILATPLDKQEKRLALSGLGTMANAQALALATPMLEDSSVRAEAAQAVIHISEAISAAHPAEAGAALKKVLAMSINPATRKSAEKAFKNIRED